MRFNHNTKIGIISIGGLAVVICGVCFLSGNKSSKDTKNYSLNAGVASVMNSEVAEITTNAGVSSVLNDFETVQVVDTGVDTVASGQVLDDGTICGFDNLAVANIEEGNLNIRAGAGVDYKVVGKMTAHNACDVLEADGDWSHIISGDVDGWVMTEYLIFGEEAETIAMGEVMTVAEVNTTTLRLRSEANTESSTITLLGDGEDLLVTEVLGDWVEVEVDGEPGYVAAEFVDITKKLPMAKTIEEIRYGGSISSVRVDLVNNALQYVGNRYVWGGTSLTNGVDCSGFTMKIYEQYNIYLPHHSGSQPAYGTKIDASEAQPGDLFFYADGGRISHVAIYIGNGQIVHASSPTQGIIISNAYYKTPVCVVSYLN